MSNRTGALSLVIYRVNPIVGSFRLSHRQRQIPKAQDGNFRDGLWV